MPSNHPSAILTNSSGKGHISVEQLIGRCTLITNSPSWLTPTGGFFMPSNHPSAILTNSSGKGHISVEQLIGRCTLITNSPSWLTPTGGFFITISNFIDQKIV
ncbi:hypothetical protein H6G18_15750 [Anabaena subtropica FACHB-260]|uniref:Uncharacterized protein n=2 Tax=Anabaena TaxID=1163 RepID=A0ABR8CRU2_9NOST|nr:hypothetical protein [Anabaena subtropica FACHB-260]